MVFYQRFKIVFIVLFLMLATVVTAEEIDSQSQLVEKAEETDHPVEYKLREDSTSASSESVVSDASTLLLGLLVVLGAIAGLAYVSKRFNFNMPGASANMKLVNAMSVGPKEKVMLLEVEGEKLLIGVTGQQITLLKSYDSSSVKAQTTEFSQRMQNLLKKGEVEDA